MDMKTNPRELTPPPPLMKWTPPGGLNGSWGLFGWEGAMADLAVSQDAPDALEWLHEHGIVSHETRTFFNTPLRDLCIDRAPKCAALLAKLGYPSEHSK